MIVKDNGVPRDSHKRKTKEKIAEGPPKQVQQINLFNFQGQQHFASPNNGGHQSRVQQILNAAAPFKPFSSTSRDAFRPFTSTPQLDSIAEFHHNYPISSDVLKVLDGYQMDQIITAHEENLSHALGRTLAEHHRATRHAAEETATKKLRERELELQEIIMKNASLKEMAAHYKTEKEEAQNQVKDLEQMTKSLQSRLRDAVEARRYAETPRDDAESSFADPVPSVKLECKICEERVALVMMWPCRHVCVCVECDADVEDCPVCDSVKTKSVEVPLPS